MNKLILTAPILLLAAAAPAHSQGVQMPNAPNATPPASLNSPDYSSIDSPPRHAARHHRRLHHRRPAPAG